MVAFCKYEWREQDGARRKTKTKLHRLQTDTGIYGLEIKIFYESNVHFIC